MRLCVPIPCFFGGMDFCDAIKRVSELGFDAVETYNWKQLDLGRVRETCRENGVELLSMCTSYFNMTAKEERGAWLEGLCESVLAVNQAGVSRLITQVGPDTGEERARQHEHIVGALKEAKPFLEEHQVTLMIEPLNTYVNHPGYYLTSSREAFDIVREVDSPCVKVVYDIYHQQVMEGNIIPSVTANLDLIAHLHAAGHPGRHEPFFGENDYRFIFDAIDRAGYTGACGLEYGPTLPPAESLLECLKRYGGKEQ